MNESLVPVCVSVGHVGTVLLCWFPDLCWRQYLWWICRKKCCSS